MQTNVPERLLKIVDDICEKGDAPLTRLTVLKKWFEHPDRLKPFGAWVAARGTSRKGKATGEAAILFREARALLAAADKVRPRIDRTTAAALHSRLRMFQNEFKRIHWGDVRIIRNWQLLLVEKGLEIVVQPNSTPGDGYQLAADYCQNYDPRYGNTLNGPSTTKIIEIARWMFTLEALEDVIPAAPRLQRRRRRDK